MTIITRAAPGLGPGVGGALGAWVPLHTLRPPLWRTRLNGDLYSKNTHDYIIRRIRVPLPRPIKIAVLSLKGGVGKTFTSNGIGATIGIERSPQLTALLDVDPDAGSAGIQVGGAHTHSWYDLLRAASTDLSVLSHPEDWATRTPNNLDLYPAPPNPSLRGRMNEEFYVSLVRVLGNKYWVTVLDSGTGLASNTIQHALVRSADAVIISTSTDDSDLAKAVETRKLLSTMGFGRLGSAATVAVWQRPHRRGVQSPWEFEDDVRNNHFTCGTDPLTDIREVVVVPHADNIAGRMSQNPLTAAEPTRAAWRAIAASAISAAVERITGQ
ncbi:MAG: hypothetical protein ABJD68_05010 [Nakamurella sp.]